MIIDFCGQNNWKYCCYYNTIQFNRTINYIFIHYQTVYYRHLRVWTEPFMDWTQDCCIILPGTQSYLLLGRFMQILIKLNFLFNASVLWGLYCPTEHFLLIICRAKLHGNKASIEQSLNYWSLWPPSPTFSTQWAPWLYVTAETGSFCMLQSSFGCHYQ